MRQKIFFTIPQFVIILAIIILATSTITVLAKRGTTDAPNAPGLTSSYTLLNIYRRITSGEPGSRSTFTEPSVAPGTGTMHDLNDIMAAAPAVDNANGATPNEVLASKTFWGLNYGYWGVQTGSIPVRDNITGPDGQLMFNIPNGYYDSKTATAADTNLIADNIRHGVTIFGITGNYQTGWGVYTTRGTWLEDLDMLTSTDGWAVGGTYAFHWDGSTWSSAYNLPAIAYTLDMVSSNDIWAVGYAHRFYHWDGSNWSTHATGEASFTVNDIHMVNSSNGWAVGNSGRIYHYDGSAWSLHTTVATGRDINTIYMLSSDDGWAMGDGGDIYRWNGSTWSRFTTTITSDLTAVDMLDSTDGWVVGTDSAIYHWDGSTWIDFTDIHNAIADFVSLDMISPTEGWAAGDKGEVYYWDGSAWKYETNAGSASINGLVIYSSINGWAVNENGSILALRD